MSNNDRGRRRFGIASALIAGVAIGAVMIGGEALAAAPPTYSFSQTCSEPEDLPVITNTGTGVITAYAVMNFSVLNPGGSTVIGYYDPSNPDPADVMWFVGAGGFSENPTIIGSGNFAVCTDPEPTTTTATTSTTSTTTTSTTVVPTTTVPSTTTTTEAPGTPAPTVPSTTTTTTTEAPGTPAPPVPSTTITTTTSTEAPGTPTPPAGPNASISDSSPTAGDDVTVTANGFVPGESVTAVLHSTPRTLGTVNADADGRVTIDFEILASDAPGSHRVVFTGATTGSVSVGATIAGSTLPATGGDISTATVLVALSARRRRRDQSGRASRRVTSAMASSVSGRPGG